VKIKDNPDFKSKSKPITLLPKNTVREALDIMCDKNIGSIIVTNMDNSVAGIITERDLMIRVFGKSKDPDKIKLSSIMTKDVKTANENDELVDWMQVMSKERFRHLPIIDENNKLISVMSPGDFMAYTYPDLYEKLMQNLKGRLGWALQVSLILFAIMTLALIAFRL
jgi:CBS domain-containing protein